MIKLETYRVWLEEKRPRTDEELEEEDFDPEKPETELLNPEDYRVVKIKKSFLLKDVRSIEAAPKAWQSVYSKHGIDDICQVYLYHDDSICVNKTYKEMNDIWGKFLDKETYGEY